MWRSCCFRNCQFGDEPSSRNRSPRVEKPVLTLTTNARKEESIHMSVEFIRMISTQPDSKIHPPSGPAIDVDYVRQFAQAHEQSGFDRILIGYFSNGADGFIVAQYAAFVTEKLGLMLAHRPGFVAPTVAARKLATLDHFSGGRLAVHIISGGDDGEQRKDGDYITHDERY